VHRPEYKADGNAQTEAHDGNDDLSVRHLDAPPLAVLAAAGGDLTLSVRRPSSLPLAPCRPCGRSPPYTRNHD
jgi:hypothetical protein